MSRTSLLGRPSSWLVLVLLQLAEHSDWFLRQISYPQKTANWRRPTFTDGDQSSVFGVADFNPSIIFL